ncbi:uncharacterized protein [Physcomitrium patens]|uniref:uncharacterized protein isoform X2 n=1 Tax=Physcomitrium patens TaxID=3218 RepID=UPI000D156685|nr:uncharacterized protein LOC112290824 isoform X2 [Physcomitrium patens]|eukprot:XP_024393324.1 uncharacterized protein LOC112290824 isoform X2 [Physcomitrella patens]
MGTIEPIEFRAKQRESCCNSSEMERSSPASTSYGGSSPSSRDNRNAKADKIGQPRRRVKSSLGSWGSFERAETQDSEPSGDHNVEEKSTSFKQDRKQQKAWQSLALKVCLNQKQSNGISNESETSSYKDQNELSNCKTFERLVQLSELEEEVLSLQKQLAEELELRAVLESALEPTSGTLNKFPCHLPLSARELLANITLLEVAVLKLEEQTSVLQNEVGHARIEREIFELRHSSAGSAPLSSERSNLYSASLDSNANFGDNHSDSLPSISSSSQEQQLKPVSTSTLEEMTGLQSCTSPRQKSQFQLPQKSWKEQRALILRQDLHLTIPESPEDDYVTISPPGIHHECNTANDIQSQRLGSFWEPNPLEQEEHWIPLNEHQPQATFAEAYCGSPQDCYLDPSLVPVACVGDDDDPHCFSPAFIAKTLRPHSPDLADLAEDDDKFFLPVAEVLWKPSTVKPLSLSRELEDEIPTMAMLATKPKPSSFTSKDDHPWPESESIPHSMVLEEQPWAQLAEADSIDEQRTKYRNDATNVREFQRQGTVDKNPKRVKSFGSSRTSSFSSVKSSTLLSSIWSPVDARAVNRDEYDSQNSTIMDNDYDLASTSYSPNELSEQMVRCMISIYRHLADSNNSKQESLSSSKTQTSTSPLTATTNSSASLVTESSILSVNRSPLVDLRSKGVLGNEDSPDPFKSRGKIPWADIGPYAHVLEVSWLSVGKDQLEFAAQALGSFKILVEQLSRLDPSNLKHEEKLAFWINLYNALLMHAYLAYGIPKSDLKFFALLQKAAYTVGGHSFNAATMEFCLLRSKSTAHRPQLTLLMSLHKNKLTEDRSKFGIDHPESLASFGLCSGTRSSPMVRVYTAKHVKAQLEDSLRDYARAAVGISTKGRLLIPKLLYTYAREHVEDADIMDWVFNRLLSNQVDVVSEVVQQRRHRLLGSRNFNVLPNDFTFRYLFPSQDCSKLRPEP